MPSHKHIFEKYLTECFIETGTFEGQGIEYALEVGFPEVRSVDIYEPHFKQAKEKFKERPVKLYLGASEDTLWEMIKDVDYQCTFWLDGHGSGIGTPKSTVNCPLLMELDIIKNHPIKNHTIMIDDIRCCGSDLFDGITKEQLEKKLLEINPDYTIVYEDSWEPRDIMVAFIK